MFVSIEGRRNFGDDFCGGGEREVKNARSRVASAACS
jgi:hypothetical protein